MSVAAPPPLPPAPASPSRPRYYRWSVDDYHRMIEVGILTDEDKVELLDGHVVLKMPRNPPHDTAVMKSQAACQRILPSGWCYRSQCAVTLATSEPEPDGLIARGGLDDYATRHPGPRDTGLVVEVADSSLDRDRNEKGPIYATAGITEYWIVNVVDRQIEVYTQPSATGYVARRDYRAGDSVPVTLDGIAIGQVAVADVLP